MKKRYGMAALALALLCSWAVLADEAAPEPRVLGSVPDFELTDEQGRSFGMAQLRGKVWLATFIFTRCGSTCPLQTAAFTRLQSDFSAPPFADLVRLVSVSVDPAYDTPEVLKRYAGLAQADPKRWTFLTGERTAIWNLCKLGFKLPVIDAPENADELIVHSQSIALVDTLGRVRGYYDALDAAEIARLKQDVSRLVGAVAAAAPAAGSGPAAAKAFVPSPEGVNPPWVEARRAAQLATIDRFKVFHAFRFTDRQPKSGLDFVNEVTDDSARNYRTNHYDHGSAVATADVDGDGRLDLYFVTQMGSNRLYRNLGDGRFEDITAAAGVGVGDRVSVGGSFADYDNDGDPDLFVSNLRRGSKLFRNDGRGKFSDVTAAAGLVDAGHPSAATFFDYDRDGLLDLFVAHVGQYTIDEQGNGGYYLGFDDGFSGHLKPERLEPSRLYRNLGDGRFRDVTETVGLLDDSWTGDATPLDANRDGWPDLYLLDMQGHDEYYENVKGEKFVKKSRELFPRTPWGSMSIKNFDYDNDGALDLYITDMHSDMSIEVPVEHEKRKSDMKWTESFLRSEGLSIFGNALFRNVGENRFEEVSDAMNAENYWPWGFSAGDLNADGFDDLFVASSMNFPFRYGVNTLFLNNRGAGFLDSEYILGVEPRRDGATAKVWFTLDCAGADRSHRFCRQMLADRPVDVVGALGSRSSVLLDLDADGDLDIVTNEFGSEPMVLISDLSVKRKVHYLSVSLKGSASNRSGLGARVTLKSGEMSQLKVHDGKSGYLAQSAAPLYFGLGDAAKVDRIEVLWPSGRKQVLDGPIEANRLMVIEEPAEGAKR